MDERTQRFYNWYQEGFSYDDIADKEQELNPRPQGRLSRESVSKILKKYPGFEPRDKSESASTRYLNDAHLPPDAKDIFQGLLDSGLTIEQVSRVTNRPIALVRRVIKKQNRIVPKQENLPPEIQERNKKIIFEYFENKKLISELSEEFNLIQPVILEILQTSKRPLRSSKEDIKIQRLRSGKIVSEELAKEAIRAKTAGIPYSEFAREHNIKYSRLIQTIYQIQQK